MNPHTQDQMKKVEAVQIRAARYVTNRFHNTSSITNMLEHLEWETLETRRTKIDMCMTFKILNNLVNIIHEDVYHHALASGSGKAISWS